MRERCRLDGYSGIVRFRQDLKRFNPWLRDRKLLTAGKTYMIRIPKESDMYYKTPNTYVHNPAWVVK